MAEHSTKRLLVFNCHEAWVYQLACLPYELDIVVGLPGRHTPDWDKHTRPIPPNARLIRLEQIKAENPFYSVIITHNPSDLLDIRNRLEPCILVLHLPLVARILLEKPTIPAPRALAILNEYVNLRGVHVVAVSELKGRSWGYTKHIIPFGIDSADYPPHVGTTARGLRISNYINQRKSFLNWDFHAKAFGDIPVTLVGHNPDMVDVNPSRNWDHLKEILSRHRFYIHTADIDMEDGFNMAMVEAMAAGLPVLGNCHPTSLVENGINGFTSNDPEELNGYAKLLMTDAAQALRMGQAARRTVRERFSMKAFRDNMENAIVCARHRRYAPPEVLGTKEAGHTPSIQEKPAIKDYKTRRRSRAISRRKVGKV